MVWAGDGGEVRQDPAVVCGWDVGKMQGKTRRSVCIWKIGWRQSKARHGGRCEVCKMERCAVKGRTRRGGRDCSEKSTTRVRTSGVILSVTFIF